MGATEHALSCLCAAFQCWVRFPVSQAGKVPCAPMVGGCLAVQESLEEEEEMAPPGGSLREVVGSV